MKFLTLFMLFSATESLKILVVFPMPGKSHSILGKGVVDTLSQAGHEVTYITQFPVEDPAPNVKQIDISSLLAEATSQHSMKLKDIGKNTLRGYMLALMGPMFFEGALAHENVQKLLNDTSKEFDVVVAEWFFTNLFSGFAAVYKVPLIWMSSWDPHWHILDVIDEPSNPAYTAGILTTVAPPFNFLERVEELFSQLYMKPLLFIAHHILERPIYNKCFGPAFDARGAVAPPYSAVAYNVSFMFFNGQPVLSAGYRLTQNARYIGGYHVDPDTKPLPEKLKKILDDAKYGVIYFSMGSNIKSKDMHENAIQGLVKLFESLKETVIWKFEEEMKDLPPNLHILKWAPQPSILNHSKTKLFITHGGKLSTTEAIYYGVPVIGIPIFGDQFQNMGQAVLKGYGLIVDYEEDLAKPLKIALNEMLNNESYSQKAKQISTIFHDSIATPRQELVHWVEHVARTQGAPHLRSMAFQVPWYQKIYLDLIILIAITYYILRKILSWMYYLSSSRQQVYSDKKKN